MQTSTSPDTQLSDPHSNTSEPASTRQKWLPAIAIYVAVGALAVVGSRLLGVSWLKILTIGALVLVFSVLGILSAVYKWVGEWIDKGFKYYFVVLGWLVVAFAPISIIVYLNRGIATLPRTLQVVIFLLWGVLLAYFVSLVATERKRQQLFKRLEARIGRFTPVAYSFNLLMIAIIFFSSITFVLAHDRIQRVKTNTTVTAESIQDFYLWHFLEAVPVLRVNETIRWKRPMDYYGNLIGWILLLFKLAVIIPVIACFASYWRNFGVSNTHESTGRRSQCRARSAGRYTRRAGGSTYYRRTAQGYARSNR